MQTNQNSYHILFIVKTIWYILFKKVFVMAFFIRLVLVETDIKVRQEIYFLLPGQDLLVKTLPILKYDTNQLLTNY